MSLVCECVCVCTFFAAFFRVLLRSPSQLSTPSLHHRPHKYFICVFPFLVSFFCSKTVGSLPSSPLGWVPFYSLCFTDFSSFACSRIIRRNVSSTSRTLSVSLCRCVCMIIRPCIAFFLILFCTYASASPSCVHPSPSRSSCLNHPPSSPHSSFASFFVTCRHLFRRRVDCIRVCDWGRGDAFIILSYFFTCTLVRLGFSFYFSAFHFIFPLRSIFFCFLLVQILVSTGFRGEFCQVF